MQRRYLSVADLGCPKDGLIIMLKAFYDASGKVNVQGDKFITLAGVIGTVSVWRKVERLWLQTLAANGAPVSPESGKPYFHSRETVPGIKGYKKFNQKRSRDLIRQLNKLLGGVQYAKTPFKHKLVAVACTIDRKEYDRAKRAKPHLPDMERLCIDHCLPIIWRLEQSRYGVLIEFDNSDDISEPYFVEFERVYRKRNRRGYEFFKRVRGHGKIASSKDCPAMQVADLLAWGANRFCERRFSDKWKHTIYFDVMSSLIPFHVLYDAENLDRAFDKLGRRRKSAKIKLMLSGTGVLGYMPEMMNAKKNAKQGP